MQLNSLFKHWSYRIIAPGALLREKYEALKRLLQFDIRCHEEMAEFQDLLHDGHREDLARIRSRFDHFSQQVAGMVESLDTKDPGTYATLKIYHKKFDFYTRVHLASPAIDFAPPYVLQLSDLDLENKQIGNKAKHLAVLQKDIGTPVPRGFAISTSGFHYFIEYNNIRSAIEGQLADLDINSSLSLNEISARLADIILTAEVPPEIEKAMLAAYDTWAQSGDSGVNVAVRSSAINEDGDCSFAGLYTTVLNVARNDISTAYRQVLASKYSPEALFYRISQGLGDEETAMSVLVQEMVQAKASGVLYTIGVAEERNRDQFHLHV
ncbi:MAG: PEP/pyruvate-binding domain-containing protein, partial [Desulforhopalus sp.]